MLKRLFSNAAAFDYENLGDLEKMSARLKINERPFENKWALIDITLLRKVPPYACFYFV